MPSLINVIGCFQFLYEIIIFRFEYFYRFYYNSINQRLYYITDQQNVF